MHIDAHLDVDMVAIESEDAVTVMLDLAAPETKEAGDRPENAAIVVLDRSGSMAGHRLSSAKRGLLDLVARLDDRDSFGLVAFDTEARVVVPAGRIGELGRDRIRTGIRSINTGGMTDLSSGYLRGLQEARRVVGDGGATIIVLSDGHANSGIVDPAKFRDMAAQASQQSVTTSSIGIGTGYDDLILSEIAIGGTGNHSFAEDGDTAAAAVAAEVDGLLSKTVQAASLFITTADEVASIAILNDLEAQAVPGGVLVELGDFYSGEQRRLLLRIGVPAIAGLGLCQVASLEFTFVAIPELEAQTITVPVSVNVVPQDVAKGRVPDPEVHREKLIQDVQRAKRASEAALRVGDVAAARTELTQAREHLNSAPESGSNSDVAEELQFLDDTIASLAESEAVCASDLDRAGKSMSASRTKRARGYTSRRQGGDMASKPRRASKPRSQGDGSS